MSNWDNTDSCYGDGGKEVGNVSQLHETRCSQIETFFYRKTRISNFLHTGQNLLSNCDLLYMHLSNLLKFTLSHLGNIYTTTQIKIPEQENIYYSMYCNLPLYMTKDWNR